MSLSEIFLPEFEAEMAITRRVLDRIPEDKLEWKAHPKSNTIGWLGGHLAEIPGWTGGILTQDVWDLSPPGGEPYKSPVATSRSQVLAIFDEGVADGKKALAATSDADFAQPWSLKFNGETLFTMPRASVIRTWVLNHIIHHRGIMTVYYRLNDVPVPSIYGPSGDEQG